MITDQEKKLDSYQTVDLEIQTDCSYCVVNRLHLFLLLNNIFLSFFFIVLFCWIAESQLHNKTCNSQ